MARCGAQLCACALSTIASSTRKALAGFGGQCMTRPADMSVLRCPGLVSVNGSLNASGVDLCTDCRLAHNGRRRSLCDARVRHVPDFWCFCQGIADSSLKQHGGVHRAGNHWWSAAAAGGVQSKGQGSLAVLYDRTHMVASLHEVVAEVGANEACTACDE